MDGGEGLWCSRRWRARLRSAALRCAGRVLAGFQGSTFFFPESLEKGLVQLEQSNEQAALGRAVMG